MVEVYKTLYYYFYNFFIDYFLSHCFNWACDFRWYNQKAKLVYSEIINYDFKKSLILHKSSFYHTTAKI